MKALKINVIVTTTAGIQIPAGAVVVPTGSNYQRTVTNPDKTKFTAQFVLETYVSQAAFEANKKPISQLVADYPIVLETKVSVLNYEDLKAEALAVKEVKQELKKIYVGANDVEEIDVILP